MSKKNGNISLNKEQINGTKALKYKNSLIDLVIKKIIYSKKILLKFFSGKK